MTERIRVGYRPLFWFLAVTVATVLWLTPWLKGISADAVLFLVLAAWISALMRIIDENRMDRLRQQVEEEREKSNTILSSAIIELNAARGQVDELRNQLQALQTESTRAEASDLSGMKAGNSAGAEKLARFANRLDRYAESMDTVRAEILDRHAKLCELEENLSAEQRRLEKEKKLVADLFTKLDEKLEALGDQTIQTRDTRVDQAQAELRAAEPGAARNTLERIARLAD